MIAATGVVLFIGGAIYPSESDGTSQHYEQMSTKERFENKWYLFTDALKLPEIQRMLLFFFIASLLTINLEEFLIYYNAGMMVTALQEAYANIAFFSAATITVFFLIFYWKKFEARRLQVIGVLARVASALFFMLEVSGFLSGRLTPYQSLIINCAFFRSLVEAFMLIPGLIFYSKMVPHHIEGMMMGFALSIIKFN